MAKNYGNYYGRQQQAPSRNGLKFFALFLALIVIAEAITIAAAIGSKGFTVKPVADWFNGWGKGLEQTEQPPVVDNPQDGDGVENNPLVVETVATNSMRLAAAPLATAAADSYTLQANVLPSETTDKTVDYSIAWKNANSTWANGKNISDYLIIAQATDGSLTATLTCLQPFGEQAIVTVRSRSNAEATATATVDCAPRYVQTNLTLENSLTLDGDTSAVKTWDVAKKDNFGYTKNTYRTIFSASTLSDPEYSAISKQTVSITTSDELRTELKKVFASYESKYTATCTYPDASGKTYQELCWKALFSLGGGDSTGFGDPEGPFSFCSKAEDYGYAPINADMYNKLKTCLQAASVDFIVTVKTTLTFLDTNCTTTYKVNVLDSSLDVLANSVQLTPGKIEF